MSTTELKYTLFRAIDTINDNKTLKDIYTFISRKTKPDFWKALTKDQKEEIEKAINWRFYAGITRVLEEERKEKPTFLPTFPLMYTNGMNYRTFWMTSARSEIL
jgi:hypothetical protein